MNDSQARFYDIINAKKIFSKTDTMFDVEKRGFVIHFFLYKQPVYKQPVLRPLKNVATFEAQKSPVA